MCKGAGDFYPTFNHGWISASQCYGEMDHGGRRAGVVDGVYRWYGAQCRIAILTVSAERQRCRTILGLERLSADASVADPDRRCIGGYTGAEAGIYDRDRGIP